MKKNLLALSMMATAGLFAQNGNDQPTHNESGYCNTCCCSPCCCKPCCVPQPKKCIDCECYTPQFYDLQCDWGVFLDAEFLYWYASEPNLEFAGKTVVQGANNQSSIQIHFDFVVPLHEIRCIGSSWDPGLRIGLGLNNDCDGWDFYLDWTYFKTSKSESVKGNSGFFPIETVEGITSIFNPWKADWATIQPAQPFFNALKGSWKVRFNQIDLEIGRKYWLSPCFTLRPYTGLRGAWTKTQFNIKAKNGPATDVAIRIPDDPTIFLRTIDRFRNRHWGVGLLAGIQPNWYVCSNFILYGNFDTAIIWGEHKGFKKQKYLFAEIVDDESLPALDVSNVIKNNCSLMSTILDVAIGIRWEETWCCDRYRTTLDIGWEHHTWFDYAFRYKTPVTWQANFTIEEEFTSFNTPRALIKETSNLGYGGFVLRARFDF